MWKKSESPTIKPTASPVDPLPQESAPHKTPLPSQKPSVIGPTISINGNVTGEEDLLIEGSVEGKVEFKQHSVTIGEMGRIKADIYGRSITIDGKVEGNLFGTEQLTVRRTGTVRGNIVSPRVALEDGCSFKGNIDMRSNENPSSTAASGTLDV
jgi:cytoskeletal protein CcmA (bactofilin family)